MMIVKIFIVTPRLPAVEAPVHFVEPVHDHPLDMIGIGESIEKRMGKTTQGHVNATIMNRLEKQHVTQS